MTTRSRWQRGRFGWLSFLLFAGLAAPRPAVASSHADQTAPCCSVSSVDARTQTVTARETATGRNFTFKVLEAGALRTFAVGSRFDVDLRSLSAGSQFSLRSAGPTRTVSGAPCCTLLSLPVGVAGVTAEAALLDPRGNPARQAAGQGQSTLGGAPIMAVIVSVDASSGVATARNYGSGAEFLFSVARPQAQSVRVGQGVKVDAQSQTVTVPGVMGSFRLLGTPDAPGPRAGGRPGGWQPYTGAAGGDEAPRLECEKQSGDWICTTLSMGDSPGDSNDDTIRCVCAVH